jgi:hypothetical protein
MSFDQCAPKLYYLRRVLPGHSRGPRRARTAYWRQGHLNIRRVHMFVTFPSLPTRYSTIPMVITLGFRHFNFLARLLDCSCSYHCRKYNYGPCTSRSSIQDPIQGRSTMAIGLPQTATSSAARPTAAHTVATSLTRPHVLSYCLFVVVAAVAAVAERVTTAPALIVHQTVQS